MKLRKMTVRDVEIILGYPPGALEPRRIEREDVERWEREIPLLRMLPRGTNFGAEKAKK